MYIGATEMLAIIIALVGAMTVIYITIRQNMELQRDNINLRRKIRVDKDAR
jgi:hypothetical protein